MLVILCGPTASGKTTIQDKLVKDYDFERIVTTTTRPKRYGEKEGVDYHFTNAKKFERMIKEDDFVEYTEYSDERYYGLTKGSLKDTDKVDKVVVLTPSGMRAVKKYAAEHGIGCFVVYVIAGLGIRVKRYLSRFFDLRVEDIRELYGRIERDTGMFENFEREVNWAVNTYTMDSDAIADMIAEEINDRNSIFTEEQKESKEPKQIKKIYMDFDNTIIDTRANVVRLYNEDFKYQDGFHKVSDEEVKTYDFKECNLLTRGCLDYYFDNRRFYEEANTNVGFWKVMDKIVKDMKLPVDIVTLGSKPNIIHKKVWFNEMIEPDYDAEMVGFIGISIEKKDKSSIDMSDGVLIDDNIDMLKSSNAPVKICFGDYGWNKDWHGLRARNWEEVMKLLEKILGENKNEEEK